MRSIIVACVLAAVIGAAEAHKAMSGWTYPFECCHNLDCAELAPGRVKPTPGGYLIDGKFLVLQKDVRFSPDGRYHGCFPKPDKMGCFWAPMQTF